MFAAFLALTLAISWGIPGILLVLAPVLPFEVTFAGYSPLAFLVVWAPAIAAFVVVGIAYGREGVRDYGRRISQVRGRWPWYAAVVVGIPAVYFVAAAFTAVLGGPDLRLADGWLAAFLTTAGLRLLQGPIEELGWRGLALPVLQRRYSGLGAALVLGFVWSVWHAPATVIAAAEFARGGGSMPVTLVRLFVGLMATSVVMTAVYNGSGGSVPLMVLFHWLTNLAYLWETTTSVPLAQDALTVLVAVAMVFLFGRQYLGDADLVTDVVPTVDRDEPGGGSASSTRHSK
ncbi:CPBP family intramembrane glutamic endopeptidase [Halomicrococcus sp. NG-SE-24]|uniref:CPBP family intramembrane glutamic endopeptidase n=1 Tax=Halomicrococcus sp. NG-SE-24 TaxID=3436928 RepID=UPI003D96ECA4